MQCIYYIEIKQLTIISKFHKIFNGFGSQHSKLNKTLMITSHVKKPTDCTQKPPVTNLRDIFQHHRNFQRHETFADRILIKNCIKQ